MRIAVVGSGIAGMASAWLLARDHEVVLFEADSRLGGHTDSHDIEINGKPLVVDSGFIVFNEKHYPLLTRMFDELGVASQSTTMSFSVHDEASGIQYNASNLRGLFCQPTNLFSPQFLGMLADLRRFYREAPTLLEHPEPGPSLGEYLAANGYGGAFRDLHLVPMASALWSSPTARILDFPISHLVRFMANHSMMQLSGRPAWRVVQGGSRSYIDALQRGWNVQVRLNSPVRSVRAQQQPTTISVTTDVGVESFEHVVLACHADDALRLLVDPTDAQRDVLSAFEFQDNDTILHTDARLLPPNRGAWAAWNVHVPSQPGDDCTVSYWMNALQSLRTRDPLVVSLNRRADIDPSRILRERRYRHPVQSAASVQAQSRKAEIQGIGGISFAGAWWGHGFHEDGLRSAVDVAAQLGVSW
ncbi:MAG: FAD-dependent oxidoreductase [Dokdonella sp.]